MTAIGRLQQLHQQHQAMPPCTCGHEVEAHKEAGAPGVFPCSECGCQDYTKAKP